MYFVVRTCYLAQIDSTYLAQIYMVQINPTASFLIYVNFNFFLIEWQSVFWHVDMLHMMKC